MKADDYLTRKAEGKNLKALLDSEEIIHKEKLEVLVTWALMDPEHFFPCCG